MISLLYGLIPIALAVTGFIGFISAKPRDFSQFSLKNSYPYEYLSQGEGIRRYIYLALTFLGCAGAVYVPSYLLTLTYGDTSSFLFFFILLQILFLSGYLGLLVYSLNKEKLHFISYAIAVISSSVLSFAEGLYLLGGRNIETNGWASILSASLLFFVALTRLFPLLFKKTYQWNKLDKVTLPDGTTTYQRPSFIALALSEWALVPLYLLSELIWIIAISLI